MYDVIIKNARIPQGDDTHLTNILVKDEKIAGFSDDVDNIESKDVIDANGNLTLPGCIDSHVHFMYQGFAHRENFLTGSAAAARGGITTVVDMPDTSIPAVRSKERFQLKLDLTQPQALIDFAFWGGITGDDVGEGLDEQIKELVDAGVVSFKVYMTPSVPTFPRVTDPQMFEVFKAVSATGLPVGIHAENYAICDYNVKKLEAEGRTDGPAWAEARNELAETAAIELAINFAERANSRLHIVHMSTGAGAKLVKEAKEKGIKVTSETCPHYLYLNAQDAMTEYGSFAKIAPPLRTKEDNELLWEGLNDESVDFMATDHAPYEIESEKDAKGMNIWNSYPGIPGVETMVPMIVNGYNEGKISLSRMVEVLSKNAAIHYGLYPKKGAMEIGSDADFTVIDLDKEWTINVKEQASMSGYSPLNGMKLKGKVEQTIVRGHLVFVDEDESTLANLSDEELETLIHKYPDHVREEYADEFKNHPELHSPEYEKSYRKEHPELIDKHIRGIKGIKTNPGFGKFVKRQSVQELARNLKF